MPHIIAWRLRENAKEIETAGGTGFAVRLGERYYNRETKKTLYNNYEVVLFANTVLKAQLYRDTLIKGSIIQVLGNESIPKIFRKKDGSLGVSFSLTDAKLGFIYNAYENEGQLLRQQQERPQREKPPRPQRPQHERQQPPQQERPQHERQQPPQQERPQQNNAGQNDNFFDDNWDDMDF